MSEGADSEGFDASETSQMNLSAEEFEQLQNRLEEMEVGDTPADEPEKELKVRPKEEMIDSWVESIKSNELDFIRPLDIFGSQEEEDAFNEEDIDVMVPFRMATAYASGGVVLGSDIINKQRKAFWAFVKKLGKSIYTKGILNTSLPVSLFEARSFAERFVDCWAFAPIFLAKAAQNKDPVVRMQNTVAFVVSGLHKMLMIAKPFNPVLGETFQANFPDGSRIYTEQVSHHPAITAWQLFGAKNEYQFYGLADFAYSFHGNSTGVRQLGECSVVFAKGGKITFRFPQYYASGIVWGDTIVEVLDKCQFHDTKNKLMCDVKFNPEGGFSKMVSGWFSKKNDENGDAKEKQKQFSDYFIGDLYHYSKDKLGNYIKEDVLWDLEGSWIGYLNFTEKKSGDVKRVWDIRTTARKGARPIPVRVPLPSDCRFRLDMLYLADGNVPKAQEAKDVIENRQRNHRKLRGEFKEAQRNDRIERLFQNDEDADGDTGEATGEAAEAADAKEQQN